MVSRKILWMVLAACSCWVMFTGCSQKQAPSPFTPAITCQDALSGDLSRLSAYEVEGLLDDALKNRLMEECWQPLIKQCLDQNIDIPQTHLARAVHEFNRNKTESYFHKSVFRYYSTMASQGEKYTDKDRALLTAYCRHVVDAAVSATDPNVKNAELLARRLDPDLHDKMFR